MRYIRSATRGLASFVGLRRRASRKPAFPHRSEREDDVARYVMGIGKRRRWRPTGHRRAVKSALI